MDLSREREKLLCFFGEVFGPIAGALIGPLAIAWLTGNPAISGLKTGAAMAVGLLLGRGLIAAVSRLRRVRDGSRSDDGDKSDFDK